MIKLCFKEYDYKINMRAMDVFKKATGKDLWFTLVSLLTTYIKNRNEPLLVQMQELSNTVDFDTGAHLLYSIIKQGTTDTSLDEIRDGMFRCGYRPVDHEDSEHRQPYTILLVLVAQAYDEEISQVIDVKKK